MNCMVGVSVKADQSEVCSTSEAGRGHYVVPSYTICVMDREHIVQYHLMVLIVGCQNHECD